MGNTSACCSTDNRCCSASASGVATGDLPVPATSDDQPHSSEVTIMSTDKNTPGFDVKLNVAEAASAALLNQTNAKVAPNGTQSKSALQEEACEGGGDSAVSATNSANASDYQHVTYEDGSTYTGQIADSKRQGDGLWQSRTGQYEGQWNVDQQHGKGRQTWSDGRVYEGNFKNGRFDGLGRMVWHTQKGLLIYEGQYEEDLKHGKGKFIWPDGRAYDGEWVKGKRHGRGLYTNARSQSKTGVWNEDKFERWDNGDAPNS